ncbi:SRPBCC domain-containing protein [Flavilitoribacter nigricans]|uniref:ATPase n=1 Tax=Flavilitoribacter nigricans (strain ATCC 23147 / DSM 23189 / NBRC 102662 / NCIMB 1420 / SS-2) TaxID=1122177 RepID=A0A2D0NF37_FLAN2|nr:SRPBCC domain-containing protein [Flavilitoribacter nigricans]PHN07018.1 ATPase [Flavilitoribacter nigricans DSM 23189 = NBRC 102662]
MQLKTKIDAEDGRQELRISRKFELPLELLFKAYTEPEILEQWMGTKVLKLENEKYGSWQFETTDPRGNKHRFSGVIHEFVPDRQIIRTFEMVGTGFGVQLEFLEFESITEETSRLDMHIVYRSAELRDQYLKIGMPRGLSMAHDRLQEAAEKYK